MFSVASRVSYAVSVEEHRKRFTGYVAGVGDRKGVGRR